MATLARLLCFSFCSLAMVTVGCAGVPPAGDPHLLQEISATAASVDGRVGAGVLNLDMGQVTLVRSDDRFPMHSVYKLPIAMAVLHEVDAERWKLDQAIHIEPSDYVPQGVHSPLRERNGGRAADAAVIDLLRVMLIESDGTASDVLLRELGGPERVTSYLRSELKVDEVVVATTEREMAADEMVQYRNWSTPRGMLKLLRLVHEGRALSKASNLILMRLMIESTTGPRRLKGLLPPCVVAHKTGTAPTVNGLTRATNDVGLIQLPSGAWMAVVVFVSDSRADTAARERVIARVARAAWDRYAR